MNINYELHTGTSLIAQLVKNPPANAGDLGLIPGSGRSPREGKWQSTPVFLPGKFHGQRILVGYSRWGHIRVRLKLATKQQHSIPGTPADSHYKQLPMLKENCMISFKMHQRTGKSARNIYMSNKLKQRLEFR